MNYTICCRCISYVSLEVEADSLEEAKQIGKDADGAEFIDDGYGAWEYDYIIDENGNEHNWREIL